jgi:hypothetical protein
MSEQSLEQNRSTDERAKGALWKDRIEIITPIIMAVMAITIAWSSYQAVGRGQSQLLSGRFQLAETVWLMRDFQPGYNGASCIHEGDIMFILAPVNTDVDAHGNLLELMTGCPGRVQATVNLLGHSQCGTLSTVKPGKPGGTIPKQRSQRGSHLVLNPQVTDGRGRQAVIGIIACSTSFRTRSPLV